MNTPSLPQAVQPLFVLNPSKVKDSLEVLRNIKAHSTLAGYLCLQRTAAQLGKLTGLPFHYNEFFKEFLALGDAPENRPYINPFVAADTKLWISGNLAGSYAPSSLRGVSPLLQVLTISDGLYNLNPQHWIAARQYLAAGRQIPVLPLAVFLYRDRGITSATPTVGSLIRAFQQEFGYLENDGSPTEAYKVLYADYTPEEGSDSLDWFTTFTTTHPLEQ
ncbi:hypothetical protein [Hymenobacter actinosclerus]|uniref:Uncharacterized protein n=1 Tax=Hymenobacter actinosclerus TaxID=82805 RepID=A0A1I0IPL2_9BACT|nr:hypothetical protein [Hymenobacter actinosclerus]SET98309.1 hypothetical protein SAMN04487998_3391 [Hymenobacter actinosclerus]